MFWIILGSIVAVLLVLSMLPIWGIKWKYINIASATAASLTKEELEMSSIPQGWMYNDKNLPLWTLWFGEIESGKSIQTYGYIYSIGNNIKYRIGMSFFDSFKK